jgi:hypothetical protein
VCRKITHNAGKQAAISSKKGADSRAYSQLKAGENLSVSQVHDLRGVLDREKADIGVLISMEQRGGKPMLKEDLFGKVSGECTRVASGLWAATRAGNGLLQVQIHSGE